ncbi:MAG: hypothetical protein M0P73_18835 [Syntrophobacterales bacterium]|jgi:hypothetical protein|nr:hypothetical protein [Syntrophobacterales bacterium]
MNRVTKISAWLAIGLFITSALAIFPAAAAAQTLDISIESETGGSPPGELVLTDPSGDRTGPEARDIHLRNPMSGLYNLRVIGRKTGTYTLYLKAYTESGSTSDVRFPHMSIKSGEVHHYQANFSAEGPKLDVRRTRVTTE